MVLVLDYSTKMSTLLNMTHPERSVMQIGLLGLETIMR